MSAKSELKQLLTQQKGRASLCAKWQNRKGQIANELRDFLGLSPKKYRKLIVALTNVVETPMCAKEFASIEFSKVPSQAMSQYMKAFWRQAPAEMQAYKDALVRGDKGVKVNASAMFPYEVIKNLQKDTVIASKQWDALPNYLGDAKVLPLVDVSGSMTCAVGRTYSPNGVSCLDVAVSLGLYCASKNTGAFADMFLNFSSTSKLEVLKGDLVAKYNQLNRSQWEMSTNLHSAFDSILNVATKAKVAPEDMPEILLIISDMQFDSCVRFDDSAFWMITRKYTEAGYTVPKIVFWNLNDAGNTPVSFDTKGTALVSGFSPALLKAVLANDLEQFTPRSVMLQAINDPRYSL